MEIQRTSLYKKKQQDQIPQQVSQGQTQQRGGYGEELKQQLQTLGDVSRKAPVIQAKKVDTIVSPTEQYTKDAIKTALEKAKLALQAGLGKQPTDTTESNIVQTSGGGGGGGNKGYFSGSDLSGMSTQQLVDRDNEMYGDTFPLGAFSATDTLSMVRRDNLRYGNTVPEGSFGSGSKSTIESSPTSAVDTNINRHKEGGPEDQPATVKFEKKEEKAPMGTTITGIGTKEFTKAFVEKQKPQTVAALPSNYKATEKAAFDKAKSWQDSKSLGKAAEKATNTPTKPKAGSFGISAEGKKTAEANKEAKRKEAKKVATKQKSKSTSTSKSKSKSSSKKSSTGSKKSSRGTSGSRSKGGTSKGGSKGTSGSKKSSRGAKGSSSSRSKGGTSKGTSRRSNTRRSRRRCDIRCKLDISILTNQNLIRDDLADVAYFVKDIQEIN